MLPTTSVRGGVINLDHFTPSEGGEVAREATSVLAREEATKGELGGITREVQVRHGVTFHYVSQGSSFRLLKDRRGITGGGRQLSERLVSILTAPREVLFITGNAGGGDDATTTGQPYIVGTDRAAGAA